jgi:hypothetical protein
MGVDAGAKFLRYNGCLFRCADVSGTTTDDTHRTDWFWDLEQAGGGAIVDLGCHCIEIMRNFIGKDIRPVEVMCTADTLVHPIEAEDHGLGWIRFDNGAVGQFEVSWTFRGGMDLRDEVAGTEGTIWLDHCLRTGFEVFSTGRSSGYVAEKAETDSGWLFPVGDEVKTPETLMSAPITTSAPTPAATIRPETGRSTITVPPFPARSVRVWCCSRRGYCRSLHMPARCLWLCNGSRSARRRMLTGRRTVLRSP